MESECQESQSKGEECNGSSFEWDEISQLYYHASSGFYHDPSAGWYYSSRDGLYYKFEDGNYVPIASVEGDQHEKYENVTNAPNALTQNDLDGSATQVDILKGDDTEAYKLGISTDELPAADPESGQMPEFPPPPSEWLEDILIDLYLSGHSNRETNVVQDEEIAAETDHDDALENDDYYELEEGEWIPDEGYVDNASESVSDEGKVYKSKRPSAKYLASISTYDSSNPTKEWGFPNLSFDTQIQAPRGLSESSGAKVIKGSPVHIESSTLLPDKNISEAYRDRAAERRALHGRFGVGPCQKGSGDDCEPSFPVLPKEAAGVALNLSFGAGSYARKLLKNMGWKEGEALGSSSKGLIEPLQAVGNKGNAGLGWDQNGRRHV